MLSKRFRLSRRDFISVKRNGKSVSLPSLNLVYASQKLGYCRFSIVLSTKFSKSAVVRNRFRRYLYSCLSTLSLALSADFIFYPHPSMLNLPHDQINSEIAKILSKIYP